MEGHPVSERDEWHSDRLDCRKWQAEDPLPEESVASASSRTAALPDHSGDDQPVYQRRFLVTACLLVISLPFLVIGSQRSFAGILTLTSRWLPATFPERRVLDQFMRDFETGDSVFITWNGCDLNDPRLHQLGSALSKLSEAQPDAAENQLIDSVMTGADVVDLLVQPPSTLSREQAARRLRGILVGIDGRSSGALTGLTESGVQERGRAMELILTEATRVTGIPQKDFILAGPPIDGWVVDQEAKSNVDWLTPPSMLISVVLCLWCLRSWPHSLAVLTSAVAAQGILLTLMYSCGIRMNALFIVLPPLVLTLTTSAGIHLVNYFRDERDTGGSGSAVARALHHGRRPCLLAAGTTAIGLLSLVRSEITPVTQFGWLAAVGVLVGVGLLFLLLPGVLERWPGKTQSPLPRPQPDGHQRRMETVPRLLSHAPTPVILLCLLIMLMVGTGIASVTTSITHDSLFPSDSRIVQDYRQLESQLGPLVPAEVLLHFPPGNSVAVLKNLKLVNEVDAAIAEMDGFGGTLSAAIFDTNPSGRRARTNSDGRRVSPAERFVEFKASVRSLRDTLKDARLLHETDGRQTWRISTRVPALGHVDYAEALERLKREVESLLDVHRQAGAAVTADYTGIMPMVSRVQDVLLHDLLVSFLSAFGLVALVTIVVLGSVPAGLLVMLPNLFPAVIVFGAMGWLQVPVDIGAMMTASVALGIAVDDTFHFLTWFRRGVSEGLSAGEAVRVAYRRCARAMLQTTLICGLGLAAFGFSHFVPTQRFAWLMMGLLTAALFGDLVFLPSLLCGATARCFAVKPVLKSAA